MAEKLLLLLGPRHGLLAGAGVQLWSWFPAGSAGQGCLGSTDSITASLLHPQQPRIFRSQGWLPAWLMPFAERFAPPVPGR